MNKLTATSAPTTGIILMAHGAPESTDVIPEYLDNIRYGLSTVPSIVQEITERYEAIGGSSPLRQITQDQSEALEKYLNQDGRHRFRVYYGMRNWSPYIRDVAKQIKADGIRNLVAMCLAPQYSRWSTELYFAALREGLEQAGASDIDVQYVNGYCNHPMLIDAFVERYRAAEQKLIENGDGDFHVVFTVHSIPAESVEKDGDPYAEQFEKTVQAIVDRVQPRRWVRAYQSQGKIPVPWLVPTVESALDRIARVGSKPVMIFPVGFVSDHIEILYDIDIDFKEYAEKRKLRLSRTESLNRSPLYIESLAAVIWEHLL